MSNPDIPNVYVLAMSLTQIRKSTKINHQVATSVPWKDTSISGSLWADLISHLGLVLQGQVPLRVVLNR